ncbi:MAG: hypothetical protein RJA07_900 [Bacteroidota bacterium]|jgi:hypothetical protein
MLAALGFINKFVKQNNNYNICERNNTTQVTTCQPKMYMELQRTLRTAGIKPPSTFDDKLLGSLKQAILLFDLVGIPSLGNAINHFRTVHKSNCSHWYIVDELDFLCEKGYLFDSMDRGGTTLKNDADVSAINKEFIQLSDIVCKSNDNELAMEAAARLSSLMLNNEISNNDFFSIPLIKRLILTEDHSLTKTDVINLIIEKMPIPDYETPWSNIFEFKSNPDNKGQFAGLRTWVNKSAISNLTAHEIKDELEFLLYRYQKSLELHKIKFNSGILQTLVVGSAELVENVIKLKFSNIAKGLFSAQQTYAELLNVELTAPGNELAYIYKANRSFVR